MSERKTQTEEERALLPEKPAEPRSKYVARKGRFEPDVENLKLPGISAFLERSGVSRDEFARWSIADPEFPVRLKKTVREKMCTAVLGVWDAVLQEALAGSVPAQRLYLEAFDESFQKQKIMEGGGVSGMLPSRDEFVRLMKAQLGPEVWEQAKMAARLAGRKYGPCNEELLPGGEAEDERVIDATPLPTASHEAEEVPIETRKLDAAETAEALWPL